MNVLRSVLRVSRTLPIIAAIIAACVVPALAQTAGTTQMSASDRAFVTSMLQISRTQYSLTLAATDPDATASHNLTAADWAGFRAHLATLAAAAGAPSPVALTAAQQTMLTQLQSAPSSNVTLLAMKDEEQGHLAALRLMRAQSSTTNPQIKQFLAYATPIQTEHAIAAQARSQTVRSGAFAWSGPSMNAQKWNGPVRSGGSVGADLGEPRWNRTRFRRCVHLEIDHRVRAALLRRCGSGVYSVVTSNCTT